MTRSAYRLLSFLILPLALFFTGLLYILITGPYFLRSADPEYAYLFNGLLIADLKMKIMYFLHPGTPMQCIAAVIIRLVHLFRPGHSMVQDVMLNPELYIRAILLSVAFLNSIALFLLGFFAFKYSTNWIMALFVQITPFTHILVLSVLGRLMPEPLMNILVCGWIILIMRILLADQSHLKFNRYSLMFGILFGISLADKLTFLPFILIPLLLLPAWKNKLFFVIYAVASFLLFAFPVTLQFHVFYDWVKGIFLHTGSYGSGDLGIIKWDEFKDHLRLQIENTWMLKWVFLVLILVTVIYIVRKNSGIFNTGKFRAGIALILVIAFEYLLTSKHFAFHYIIPAILISAFGFVLIILILKDILPGIMKPQVLNGLMIITGIIILANTAFRVVGETRKVIEIVRPIRSSYEKVGPLLQSSHKIVSVSYYGCDAIEYALTFGIHESGKYSQYLTDQLKEVYPSTLLYYPWGKVFYEGNKVIQPETFINPGIDYTLYVADFKQEGLDEILNRLTGNSPNSKYSISKVYVDSLQKKGVFKVKFF